MRRLLVAANWKMNGNKESNAALLKAFKEGFDGSADTAIFPPALYVPQLSEELADSAIAYGVQNAYFEEKGAFTGELSLSMAKEFGCEYILVGHSERRELFGETDEIVAKKVEAILAAGLIPMLCIGEKLEEREAGTTEKVCETQVKAVLDKVGIAAFEKIVIAYEPVWAIGTGKTATPEQAQDVHAFIRQILAAEDAEVAAKTRILYGGSVKAASAEALFGQPDIDGGLVGGASLIADEFVAICNATKG
ncbi:triose-phosphate isomerase [Reinekea marinisedimentorum]|uniref:Triosephosphate isomerase n=1 Tax=Reinekea marinisedimentorum TaxID=230495 RepID=A0A4R3HYD6_9GAMM|nr:triose-phosphate isomerase [Reinekea marinisedimentorum]TCS38212.1 triosephosphate isomerase [Reinekea marinisedimentorum]